MIRSVLAISFIWKDKISDQNKPRRGEIFVVVGKQLAQPTVNENKDMCFGDIFANPISNWKLFAWGKNDDKTRDDNQEKYLKPWKNIQL